MDTTILKILKYINERYQSYIMDDKGIAGFKTKISTFMIVMSVYMVTLHFVALA